MSDLRKILVRSDGSLAGTEVEVDGHPMQRGLYEVVFRHECGYVPTLELELKCLDVTEWSGKAEVAVLLGCERFTSADIEALRDLLRIARVAEACGCNRDPSPWPEVSEAESVIDRIAALLPPREEAE